MDGDERDDADPCGGEGGGEGVATHTGGSSDGGEGRGTLAEGAGGMDMLLSLRCLVRDSCFEVWFPISSKASEETRKKERERIIKDGGDLFFNWVENSRSFKIMPTPLFDVKRRAVAQALERCSTPLNE